MDHGSPVSAADVQINALRAGIDDMLVQCSEKQREFFHRIHASSPWKTIDKCPPGKLSESYELLRRTIIKNHGKG